MTDILTAVAMVSQIIQTAQTAAAVSAEFMRQAQKVADMVHAAQQQGRDSFTPHEWQTILDDNDAARDRLGTVLKKIDPLSGL